MRLYVRVTDARVPAGCDVLSGKEASPELQEARESDLARRFVSLAQGRLYRLELMLMDVSPGSCEARRMSGKLSPEGISHGGRSNELSQSSGDAASEPAGGKPADPCP